jgi:hypothetical protein
MSTNSFTLWKDPTTSQNNFNPTKKEKQINLQTWIIYLLIEVEANALAVIHATL